MPKEEKKDETRNKLISAYPETKVSCLLIMWEGKENAIYSHIRDLVITNSAAQGIR